MEEQQKRIIDIIEKERTRFMGYIRRRASDISRMDAEDILADVMLGIFNRADISIHVENIMAYIYRSIANKITDLRQNHKDAISLDYVNPESKAPLIEQIAEPSAEIDQILRQKDIKERLYAAVQELEPRQRAIWIATEIEGYSFKELSLVWNKPIGTLLSRKSRAVKALQIMLKDLKETD